MGMKIQIIFNVKRGINNAMAKKRNFYRLVHPLFLNSTGKM